MSRLCTRNEAFCLLTDYWSVTYGHPRFGRRAQPRNDELRSNELRRVAMTRNATGLVFVPTGLALALCLGLVLCTLPACAGGTGGRPGTGGNGSVPAAP